MDLFGSPLIPGLKTWHNILTKDEIHRLEERVQAMDLPHYDHEGWTAKRLVGHYSSPEHPRYNNATSPDIPQWMLGVRNRIVKAAGYDPRNFIQFSVSVYPPGAGIGWHRDMPPFRRIIGVSIGSETCMRFRQKNQNGIWIRKSMSLPPGMVYALTGDARSKWEHSISPVRHWRGSFTTRDL